MNIKIYYLDKTIILTDKHSKVLSNNSSETIFINPSTSYSLLYQTLLKWLTNTEKILYLFFNSNDLLISFVSFFFPTYFKVMYAAGGLIENNRQKFLFIYKRGYWDLPKGKIDKNETAEEAAIRECIEETGISNVSITENLGVTFHFFYQKEEWILKITQWFSMQTSNVKSLIPQIEEGIEKVEWFDKDTIRNHIINTTYPSIIDILQRKRITI
ncbi:MAG: hypothetical protein KatS3mg027_1156 [Bacteroidia bacterium]|nr:MAG: hypothetical protein KatS3mg027_1156 [Bacteroidia bacterium]